MTNKQKHNARASFTSRIKYYESKLDAEKVDEIIKEFCQYYIDNNLVPNKNFRYLDTYNRLYGKIVKKPVPIAVEVDIEEDETIKSAFTTLELKAVRKLMSNYNIQFHEKYNILKNRHGLEESSIMKLFEELGIPTSPTQFEKARFNELKKSRRYLISSAQSGSPVNIVFFDYMKTYAEFIGAEIGIIATRYRNPTSNFDVDTDVWDEVVDGYLTAVKQVLHKNLTLIGDLKIQATTPNPTNGLDGFEGTSSIIIGSPTVEMISVPVLLSQEQKFVFSTGSVTLPNFTDSLAGGKAENLHSFGFVVVEIENDDIVHIRNVVAEIDGTFNDLIYRIDENGVSTEEVDTLVWGDSHFAQKEERVTDAFRGMCTDLGIRRSVLHDVWDSQSVNVHNLKNPIIRHKLMKEGKDCLRTELEHMYEELQWFEENMEHTLVVNSNHDDMLDRAMILSDWKANLKNAEIFVELLGLKLSGKAEEGLIAYLINKSFTNIHALGVEDSYIRNGIELALHGHKGPNGSRGNIKAFGKLTTPNIIGHSHSPAIKWGTYQMGVSCGLSHGYNKGLSGWAYASVTLNKRGTRQLLILNRRTLSYTTLY